jgi:hypothetical protein
VENGGPASTAGTTGAGAPGGASAPGGAGGSVSAANAGAHAVAGAGNAASAGSPGAGSAGFSQAGAGGGGGSASAGSAAVASGGTATGGSVGNAGRGGSQATGGTGGSGSSAGGPPASCNLPSPVSFQDNIQGFLFKSCGKSVSSGCHVTDSDKTKLGYNHAYDWITAIAHPGSCGKSPPYAKRFEVILDVLKGANPVSCPNSRIMPPPGTGTPPTACELAALKAWLAEPLVSQKHVTVTDETAKLYSGDPYLMPPFN